MNTVFRFRQKRIDPLCVRKSTLLVCAAVLVGGVCSTKADNRLFTYVYEPGYSEQGVLEAEQYVTARIGKGNGHYTGWDFREELEYGLTDRLTSALYLNFSHVESDGVQNRVDQDGTTFKGVSSEWIYRVLDPLGNPVGLSLYGEVTVSDKETELEEKVILGQYWGPWAAALNIAVEQEWESAESGTEEEGVLDLTGGVARYLNRHWSVGVEARNIRRYPDYSREENSAWFVGPNVHYKGIRWGATLTVLPQVYGSGDGADDHLQLEEYERVNVRLIASHDF